MGTIGNGTGWKRDRSRKVSCQTVVVGCNYGILVVHNGQNMVGVIKVIIATTSSRIEGKTILIGFMYHIDIPLNGDWYTCWYVCQWVYSGIVRVTTKAGTMHATVVVVGVAYALFKGKEIIIVGSGCWVGQNNMTNSCSSDGCSQKEKEIGDGEEYVHSVMLVVPCSRQAWRPQ